MTRLSSVCSVCGVEFVLAGDERPGDSVICVICGASFLIKEQPSEDSKNWVVEDEF